MSATGFEPVNLACKPLKKLDLFLGTDVSRFIKNSFHKESYLQQNYKSNFIFTDDLGAKNTYFWPNF